MIYEYNNNNLSKEQIGDMLKKSKALKRNVNNIAYCFGTVGLVVFLLISFISTNFKWDNRNFILLGSYVIGILMVFLKKEVNVEKLQEIKNEQKSQKQSIEFKDNNYRYMRGKLNLLLNQNTIREIITSEQYTLIGIVPKKLKLFGTINIFIPNNLFGTKENYNEFINSLSK